MKKTCVLSAVSLFAAFLLSAEANNILAGQYRQTSSGVTTSLYSMDIEVRFITPEIVRIYKTPENSQYVKKSYTVVRQPEQVNLNVSRQGETVLMKSASLQVSLHTETGRITFFAPDGTQLFTEKDYGAQFSRFDDAGKKTCTVRQAFLLDRDEAIYGLGQQQIGELNQRNSKVWLKQRYLYACIPIFQSIKGYGIFWDNYSATTFNDNPQELSLESQVGECIDYYFMYGKTADGVIARIRELTGQSPLYPLWTYGFWQSRERYKTQQELTDVLDKYRELDIPLDGIIQDWQYWGGDSLWNAMDFLNPGFADPQAMIDHVHRQKAHIMISVWASFGPKTKPYKDMERLNALLPFDTWPLRSGVKPYDPYNEQARDLYWDYMNKGLFSKGIDAWWLDSTEPDHHNEKETDYDLPTAMGTYRSVVNLFPLMTNMGVYEHQRAVTSEKRVFLLTRCAFAGQQRYAAQTWSGDVQSDWATFKKQVPTGLNFSLSGIPYWNTDIGGFFLWDYENGVNNKAYHELYTRWFQYATFTPMQRSHGSGVKKEIWYFGKRGDWAFDSEEKYINLRYRLLPYLYSTAWDVTSNAGSFLRALFMDFRDDRRTHNIGNEYMFGKSFLVIPVTDPMYVTGEGKKWKNPKEDFSRIKTQEVYLPAGVKWIDFWTGEILEGGQIISRETPIDIIPLYVKAGSIIPWGPKVQYATEKKWDNLEIRIYPGASSEFILYEDENDNYNYEKGICSTIRFQWNDKDKTLVIGDRQGGFPGMLKNRKFNIIVVDRQNGVGDQLSPSGKSVSYAGKRKLIKI
jgi:alpha-D-xyloside xylohydrolase